MIIPDDPIIAAMLRTGYTGIFSLLSFHSTSFESIVEQSLPEIECADKKVREYVYSGRFYDGFIKSVINTRTT